MSNPPDGELSSEEYAALICAAKRFGFTSDDFECAMGTIRDPNGRDKTPLRWKILRRKLVGEVTRGSGGRSR